MSGVPWATSDPWKSNQQWASSSGARIPGTGQQHLYMMPNPQVPSQWVPSVNQSYGNPNAGQQIGQQTWNPQAASQATAGAAAAPGMPSCFNDGNQQQEQNPQWVVHDSPPKWDGQDPDNQLEPYRKLLAGWLTTSRT